jgi:hypothetical protein
LEALKNGMYQLLGYADRVSLLGEIINIKKEDLSDAGK